ncbi:hypothetical protein M011DRAFT_517056 [Sporormia fimetaria CBS 119925]|uniref:Uncharacterized protein n=1 Tax=Sporormia fimetaria CBS 119925 TaxID=1340428 RepID=A0A6A6VLR0_9PLEO|nr:hypothetical protein M011DRAFT_517056 [Sporormia fimetaria CBS 119925]
MTRLAMTLSHESLFRTFKDWADYPRSTEISSSPPTNDPAHVIQVVKQVNFGPLESKRYFAVNGDECVEVEEKWLIENNFQKLNAFKNFKCDVHSRFFEVNVYQKYPVNKHHWRADVARPAGEIEL